MPPVVRLTRPTVDKADRGDGIMRKTATHYEYGQKRISIIISLPEYSNFLHLDIHWSFVRQCCAEWCGLISLRLMLYAVQESLSLSITSDSNFAGVSTARQDSMTCVCLTPFLAGLSDQIAQVQEVRGDGEPHLGSSIQFLVVSFLDKL